MNDSNGSSHSHSHIAIALEMKKDGMSAAQISKFTKLSEEEIEKL